jgi:thioredoxin 1
MMRFKMFYTFAMILSMWSSQGFAFSALDFEAKAFQSAQAENKIILVDVFATWCPTCKAQQKDLESILKDPKYKDVVTLKINFDNKEVVKEFGKLIDKKIPRQSTILVFKGKERVSFSVAERGEKLKEHLDKAF